MACSEKGQFSMRDIRILRSIKGGALRAEDHGETSAEKCKSVLRRNDDEAWISDHEELRFDGTDPCPVRLAPSDTQALQVVEPG